MDLINILLALLSIGFGAIGWLAPHYTMDKLDTATKNGSTMGVSEVRAASGALFVGLGLGALLTGLPGAYAAIGFAWGGGAVGRLTSIVVDGSSRTKWIFFVVEAVVGIVPITINL